MGTHTAIVRRRNSLGGGQYTITMMPGGETYRDLARPDDCTMDELLKILTSVAATPRVLITWRAALETSGVLLIDLGHGKRD